MAAKKFYAYSGYTEMVGEMARTMAEQGVRAERGVVF
jgi:hypothetical protein